MDLVSQRTQVMRKVVMRHSIRWTFCHQMGHMCSRFVVVGTVGVILTACSADHSSSPIIARDSAGVTIIESLKGLWGEGEGWLLSEEPAVIIGMEEGIFPHSRSMNSLEELEEERRLCYVGITRAMEKVFLTSSLSHSIYGE